MVSAERLSEGVVVQVDVTARLLGAAILRLDGDVVLAPARVDDAILGSSDATVPALVPVATVSASPPLGSALDQAESLYAESVGILRRDTASGSSFPGGIPDAAGERSAT